MEKQGRSKGNVFQFIPGANSVTFHKPPISPARDKGSRPENWSKFKANNCRRGFSGPITSMIPAEARRKSRSGSFDAAEPTSPKVSCMGQIIHKHKKLKNKNKNKNKGKDKDKNQNQNQKKKLMISKSMPLSSHRDSYKVESSPKEAKKKPFSGILRIFQSKRSDSNVLFDDHDKDRAVQAQGMVAPSLGKMKRFASRRESLGNFDWTAHVPAAAVSDDRNYHSDEEGGGGGGGGGGGRKSDGEGDEDSIIIPHSAPIIVLGGRVALEPRKEVNLWKRRTMGPPRPLQLIPSK